MSGIKDLAYDIEQLYIEGCHPTKIARILRCPLGMVYDWMEAQNVAESPQEEYDPFQTVNS
jgi:hypothetical protein